MPFLNKNNQKCNFEPQISFIYVHHYQNNAMEHVKKHNSFLDLFFFFFFVPSMSPPLKFLGFWDLPFWEGSCEGSVVLFCFGSEWACQSH